MSIIHDEIARGWRNAAVWSVLNAMMLAGFAVWASSEGWASAAVIAFTAGCLGNVAIGVYQVLRLRTWNRYKRDRGL